MLLEINSWTTTTNPFITHSRGRLLELESRRKLLYEETDQLRRWSQWSSISKNFLWHFSQTRKTTNFIMVTQKWSFTNNSSQWVFKKKLITQRSQILVIFASTTENGWLAFLGPNKRETTRQKLKKKHQKFLKRWLSFFSSIFWPILFLFIFFIYGFLRLVRIKGH